MRIGEEAGSGGGGESVGEWPFLGSAVEEELRHVCLHQINSIAHLPFQFRVLLRPWSYWRERFGFSIHEILEIECDIAVACPLGVVLDDEVLLSRNVCVDVILREGYQRKLEFALCCQNKSAYPVVRIFRREDDWLKLRGSFLLPSRRFGCFEEQYPFDQ